MYEHIEFVPDVTYWYEERGFVCFNQDLRFSVILKLRRNRSYLQFILND